MQQLFDQYRSLLDLISHDPDIKELRSGFVDFYQRLDRAAESSLGDPDTRMLINTVMAAFEGLDLEDPEVDASHYAALKVAVHVDTGDDGTARNNYHNVLHFSKVAFNFRILAALHNQMADRGLITGQTRLTDSSIARGIFAAVAHDIFHNGIGNKVNGEYLPFRCEEISVEKAREWAGPFAGTIQRGLRLIYGTDVSSSASGEEPPARIVRHWHDHYFKGDAKPEAVAEDRLQAFEGYRQLKVLTSSRADVLLASLLQDADVLASVLGQQEDRRYAREIHTEVTPKFSLYFLENVLGGRMTTDAARGLGDSLILQDIAGGHVQLPVEGQVASGAAPVRSAAHPADGTQPRAGLTAA